MILLPLRAIGRTTIRLWHMSVTIGSFSAHSIRVLCTMRLKVTKTVQAMENVGVDSLPIVILSASFTGMVFALQSYIGFSRIGGQQFLGMVVALGMIRELGPVLTALMVTGRAGSAIAAELGTMHVTEQIDALTTLGIDPYHYLVIPRIVAGIIIVPIITLFAMFCGMIGGYLVAVYVLALSSDEYISSITSTVQTFDIMTGLIKAAVFGGILTTVGCYQGMHTQGGARGVGRATTQGMVYGSMYILITNYLLTQVLG